VFVRSSTINAQTSQLDAGIAYVNDTVMPAMSHIPGFVGLSLMVRRESGRCIASSAWRDEATMRASAERATAIRDGAAAAFGGSAEVEEWEVAVMHRAHHARTGGCMRVTWFAADPGRVDEAVETFKHGTLAKIEDLPGFCSASLMVNEADGRAVVSVGYDDRAALELNRVAGTHVRDEAMQATGATVIEVAEFDLVIARMHIPELV
jgi:hypothetical protein